MPARRRRLLSISHAYAIGLNRRLPNELARIGDGEWEVTAVAPRFLQDQLRGARYEPLPDESCHVVPLDLHFSREPHVCFWGRGMRSLLREHWDVVHLWEEPYAFMGIQPALYLGRGTPFVFQTAQNLVKRYPPPFHELERAVLRRARGWIACGETVVQAQLGRYRYAAHPRAVIPLGVDVEQFRPDRERGMAVRRELGWRADGPPVVGYLGRFVPEKGIELLTRTLERIETPWRALLVGTGPLQKELEEWARRVNAKAGERRAILATQVRHAQVPAHLNAMDLLVAPSLTTKKWREQFGRMVTEALASGVPVVSSDSGELPFTVGKTGVLVPETDEAAWVRSIEELVKSAPRREELATIGRARALREFAWNVVARRTLDFLSSVARAP